MLWWSRTIRSVSGPAAVSAFFKSKTASLGRPNCGEMAQPVSLTPSRHWLAENPSWVKLAAARRSRATDVPAFAAGSDRTWTWNSDSMKLPLPARPGPEAGSDLSVRASSRNPQMPLRSVWTTIEYRHLSGRGPLARIEPSSCAVRTTPSVAVIRFGASAVHFKAAPAAGGAGGGEVTGAGAGAATGASGGAIAGGASVVGAGAAGFSAGAP